MSLQAHFLRIAYATNSQITDKTPGVAHPLPLPSAYTYSTRAYTYSTESVSEAYSYKGSLSLDGRKGRCIQCASFKGG